MKCLFFRITWSSGVFGGRETVGKQKGRQAWFLLLSGVQVHSSLRRKEVAQTAQVHFPNQWLVIKPILCQSFLYLFSSPFPPKSPLGYFGKNCPAKYSLSNAQGKKGRREEVKLFCLFCMPELWKFPSIVLVINVLGSGKQYGSTNFY